MSKYLSPSQSIELKIKRHQVVIRRLIIAAVVIIILTITFLISARFYLGKCSELPSRLGAGVAFLCLLFSPIARMVISLAYLQIVRNWASHSVTNPLQGISALIIERTSQLQLARISGTPIG